MPEVSVLIPLYGDHHGRGFLASVTAAWLAQRVPCEVVVATAGTIPVTVADDVDGERRVRVVRAPAEARAPGLLRNAAAEHARSPLLYLSDSDLLPLGRDFLDRALALAGGRVLAQPWMHRLPGGPSALDGGSPPVDRVPAAHDGPYCFVRPGPGGALLPCPDERLDWLPPSRAYLRLRTPRIWPPAVALDPALDDKRQWRAPFHWGSLLLPRAVFDHVGGYCPGYLGWGAEDDDLLTKVSSVTTAVRAWELDRSLACLHFEHPARYFGTPEQVANHALYEERLAAGPRAMIARDSGAGRQDRSTT